MIIQEFCVNRKWIFMTISLGLVALATSAYLMYREIYRPKRPNDILIRYGKLFHNEVQLEELNKFAQRGNSKPVTESKFETTDKCKVTCPKKKTTSADIVRDLLLPEGSQPSGSAAFEKYREIDLDIGSNATTGDDKSYGNDTNVVSGTDGQEEPQIVALRDATKSAAPGGKQQAYTWYHGCCQSSQKHVTYQNLKHAYKENTNLSIVEFKKMKQYFLTEDCKQAKGCQRGCQCKQVEVTSTALVMDEDEPSQELDENDSRLYKVRLEYVKYPGPCKCINQKQET